MKLFRFSIAYLFALFLALGIDAGLAARAPRAAAAAGARAAVATGTSVHVTLSSHSMGDLAVRAVPLTDALDVRRGETAEVQFRFANPSSDAVLFQAVHRVMPAVADAHLHKLVCFCFSRQRLAAHAEAVMPVRFTLDAGLPDSVHAVVLDYALFTLPDSARSDPAR